MRRSARRGVQPPHDHEPLNELGQAADKERERHDGGDPLLVAAVRIVGVHGQPQVDASISSRLWTRGRGL
jgi:hypothetical protein